MEEIGKIRLEETNLERSKFEFKDLAEAEEYLDWKNSVPVEIRRLVESAMLEKYIKPDQTGLILKDQFLNTLGDSLREKRFTTQSGHDPKIYNFLEPLEKVRTKGGYLNVFETLTNPSTSWSMKKSIYEMQIKVALDWLVNYDLNNLTKQIMEQDETENAQHQKQKNKDSDIPSTNEKVAPGGDTGEKKEGEPMAALFSVNPFFGGYYRQLRFNRFELDKLEWQKPENEFDKIEIINDYDPLSARIISGKIQGGSPLAIPLPYDWTIDPESLTIDAPTDSAKLLKNKDGFWYLKVDVEGIFQYCVRSGKTQRVKEDAKLAEAQIAGILPHELKEKIEELKKARYPQLKLKREVVKLIKNNLKYITSDQLNNYYKQKPAEVFNRIWEKKEANCYWANTLAARAIAEIDNEWAFIGGFSVREKDEFGNAILHAGNGHSWLEVWDPMSQRVIRLDATPKGDPNVDEEQQEKDLNEESAEGDWGESDDELASIEETEQKIKEMQGSNMQERKKPITQTDLLQARFAELAECSALEAQEFLRALERVRQIKDNKGNSISNLLIDEWKKITIQRKIESTEYRGPVRMDEGDRLDDPVSARIDIRGRQYNPTGFEKEQKIKKLESDFGGINIYFSFDLSGSMGQPDQASGRKKSDVQRDVALLFVDSLMQCSYLTRQSGQNSDLLPIKIMITLASDRGKVKLHLTDRWSPKEQWAMYSALNKLASGGTPTHETLQLIEMDFDKELAVLKNKKISKEKLPLHYVAEISDGEPDDFAQTEEMHHNLKEKGAVIRSYVIGNKSPSQDVTEPIESFSDLPQILASDLMEKFKKLNPKRIR